MSLILQGVTQKYGDQYALQDVSLEIKRGDCYGFIGHNGAGKTTAMRIALGLMPPQSGRVIVDGYDIQKSRAEVMARLGGLIERPGFFDDWSGPANLVLLARLQGLTRAEAKVEAAELLDLVGLPNVGNKKVGNYSQGMRQRLGIAQALLGRPDYVLLDEPANGLDPEGLAAMRQLMLRLTQEEGLTVILSSHQLHEVAEICNRIAVLKNGRVVAEEDAQVLLGGSQPTRYLLDTNNNAQALALLKDKGIAAEPGVHQGENVHHRGEDHIAIDFAKSTAVVPADKGPAFVSRTIVDNQLDLQSMVANPPSLEEIYLALGKNDESTKHENAPDETPTPAKAPGFGTWRSYRYELTRLFRSWWTPVLLLIPALIGFWDVYQHNQHSLEQLRKLEEDGLIGVSSITAFEAFAVGIKNSLFMGAIILALIASQSISSEVSGGTLRNAILRPLRRFQLMAGKALALLTMSMITYAALIGTVLATSAYYFDFKDVVEILQNGMEMEMLKAEEVWPEFRIALRGGILPFLAYCSLGFFLGSMMRKGVAAFGLTLGVMYGLEFFRDWVHDRELDAYFLPTHIPTFNGDISFVRHFLETSRGLSNSFESHAQQPLVYWVVGLFALASAFMARRSIR